MSAPKLDEEQIFNVARKIDSETLRADYLLQVCGEDSVLRQRIESLLRVEKQDKSFLASPVARRQTPEIVERPGTVIGHYTLLEQIGEGGFGVVFLAEQGQPIQRRVAIKVLKPGMDTRQVLARFEAERQALAIMDHPHIARVLDGGATTFGRPFIVMEYVPGIPITEHCDQFQLSARERLELFIAVSQAVQHAHQKGIIHRDLKPTNVLVTMRDNLPVVKVIDFGVAKALGESLTDGTLFTSVDQMIGTPLYMSPEQAGQGGSSRDIDTRTDIYSLGVLLYELLTGTTPFEKERFRSAAYEEIRRIIREEEPPKPSTRLSDSKDALPSISAQRQTEPAKLTRLLRGELDWIVMKALDKDRNRRYATANGLAMDLRRYLDDEPVEASPPSSLYLWRKFARKNWRVLATAVAFLFLLTAGLMASTWLAVRATIAERNALAERDAKEQARAAEAQERRRADEEAAIAKAVNEFLQDDLLAQSDIGNQLGTAPRNPRITVRELFDRAADKLEGKFPGQELTQAAIHLTLGRAYGALGEYDKAQKHLERAIELKTRKLGARHPDTLNARVDLPRLLQDRGQYDNAEQLYREALKDSKEVLGPDHPDTLYLVNNLAFLLKLRGQYDQAEPLYKEVLADRRRVLGADHHDTLETWINLGVLYWESGRYDQAEPIFHQVQAANTKTLGEDHPLTILAMQNLATLYFNQNRYDEAEVLFKKVLALRRKVEAKDHPHILVAMNNLAAVYTAGGRLDEAARLLKQVLDARKKNLGAYHPDSLVASANLAAVYWKRKDFDQAIPLLEETCAQQRNKLGADHPDTLITQANLGFNYRDAGRLEEGLKCLEEVLALARQRRGPWPGHLLLQMGELANMYDTANQLDKAEALSRELLDLHRAQFGTDDSRTATTMAQLGRILLRKEQFDEALSTLRECLTIRETGQPEEWTTFKTKSLLGAALLGQKKYAEAEPLLLQGYEGMQQRTDKIPPKSKTDVVDARQRLVQLYEAWGKAEEAGKWRAP